MDKYCDMFISSDKTHPYHNHHPVHGVAQTPTANTAHLSVHGYIPAKQWLGEDDTISRPPSSPHSKQSPINPPAASRQTKRHAVNIKRPKPTHFRSHSNPLFHSDISPIETHTESQPYSYCPPGSPSQHSNVPHIVLRSISSPSHGHKSAFGVPKTSEPVYVNQSLLMPGSGATLYGSHLHRSHSSPESNVDHVENSGSDLDYYYCNDDQKWFSLRQKRNKQLNNEYFPQKNNNNDYGKAFSVVTNNQYNYPIGRAKPKVPCYECSHQTGFYHTSAINNKFGDLHDTYSAVSLRCV